MDVSLKFEFLDYFILAIYFALVFAITIIYGKKGKSQEDYFLGGKNTGWFVIGCSVFITCVSSEHVLGYLALGHSEGFGSANFEWMACIVLMLLGWLFAPFYVRSEVFTLPEFINRRYGKASKWYLTVIAILSYIITKVSVSVFAAAILMKGILGWDMYSSSLALLVLTGIYTIVGGFKPILYAGVVQTIIFIVAMIVLTIVSLDKAGGLNAVMAAVPEDYFSVIKPMDHDKYPWTGMFFGAPILAIWYWCTDQYIVQRILSAKNIDHARAGSIFAGYMKILPVFILFLPGVCAKVLYPDVADADVFSVMVNNILPVGLKGLVVAGLLSAVMSSLASSFNSSSTLFTLDIYKKIYPKAEEFRIVNVGRIATIVIVILSILWLPFIKSFSKDLIQYLQSVQSYISPPIAVIFLMAILWPRANGRASISVLVFGGLLGVLRLVLESVKSHLEPGSFWYLYADINFLHFAIVIFVVSVVLIMAISAFTPKPTEENLRGMTFSSLEKKNFKTYFDQHHKKWQLVNITASVVLVLIVVSLWFKFS